MNFYSELTREELEQQFDEVLDTQQAQEKYEFISFLAPMAQVRRRSDGKEGWLSFQHRPRFYFDFRPIS